MPAWQGAAWSADEIRASFMKADADTSGELDKAEVKALLASAVLRRLRSSCISRNA